MYAWGMCTISFTQTFHFSMSFQTNGSDFEAKEPNEISSVIVSQKLNKNLFQNNEHKYWIFKEFFLSKIECNHVSDMTTSEHQLGCEFLFKIKWGERETL